MSSKKTNKKVVEPVVEEVTEEVALVEQAEPTAPVVEEKKEIKRIKVEVTVPRLNVRAGANTNSTVIGIVDKETILTVEETKSADWLKVVAGPFKGYVMSEFVEEV